VRWSGISGRRIFWIMPCERFLGMKQAILLTGLTILALEAGFQVAGVRPVATVVYGAIALMAAMIAGTFLWLWIERTTPLATGMVMSWAGMAALAAGWWRETLGDGTQPEAGGPVIFGVLALPIVGSILHFAVMQRSLGCHGPHFLWPPVAALVVSGAVYGVVA
jgi:hypothetical protein